MSCADSMLVTAKKTVWEGTGFANLAQIKLLDASYILQANLSSITRNIYNLDDDSVAAVSSSVTISSSVYDTLQDWPTVPGEEDPDDIGYNFRQAVAHDALTMTEGEDVVHYRIVYTFQPASGEPTDAVFDIDLKSLTSAAE